jgi:hypothetical protein
MRNLSWFNKGMFLLNIVLTVTFIAYILPFLAPKSFPLLSVLTLFMPLFFVFQYLVFCIGPYNLKKLIVYMELYCYWDYIYK